MAFDPRPLVHFTPPSAWMNDPNGLVYRGGEYHLFYQYHPHSLIWGPMHWGHAVSTDLVTWHHLPVALEPDELGTIFSGSAVWDGENTSGLVPGGGLVAVFSFDTQAQGLAFSTDRGRTWEKYAKNPILPALAKDFRDPKVFQEQNHWVMVIAVGDHLEFFSSPNLRDWHPTGRFDAALDRGVWECPDLFPLRTTEGLRWVLIVSVGDRAVNGGSGTLYWVGDWDGLGFRASSGPFWLDGGTDHYAGVTWNDAPDGRILIGWMNNWRYAREIPSEGWRGSMTLPRTLTLEGSGPWLVQKPVSLAGRRRRARPIFEDGIGSVSDTELILGATSGPVVVRWSKGEVELILRWDAPVQTLVLDRSRSGRVDFHPEFFPTMVASLKEPARVLDLRVILDGTSIEVFAEGGKTVITALVFPPPGDWNLAVEGGQASGTVWDLDS